MRHLEFNRISDDFVGNQTQFIGQVSCGISGVKTGSFMTFPYRTVAPVDLHSHRLGEELPSSLQLRLVQLPPGRLELFLLEAERHLHPAAEPRAISNTACARTALPASAVTIKRKRFVARRR